MGVRKERKKDFYYFKKKKYKELEGKKNPYHLLHREKIRALKAG